VYEEKKDTRYLNADNSLISERVIRPDISLLMQRIITKHLTHVERYQCTDGSETVPYLREQAPISAIVQTYDILFLFVTLHHLYLLVISPPDQHSNNRPLQSFSSALPGVRRLTEFWTNTQPLDTSGADDGDHEQRSEQTSRSEAAQRRKKVQSRSALFNGSRNILQNRGDDEGEDEEEKNIRLRILKQCEASLNPQNNTSGTDKEPLISQPPLHNDSLQVSEPDRIRMDQVAASNSTQINQSATGYPIFDMSILGGISRIWETARNVSLFGNSHSRQNRSTINLTVSVDLLEEENSDSSSIGSDLDGLPDVSGISFAQQPNDTPLGERDPTNRDETNTLQFVALGDPAIFPISPKVKASKTPQAPKTLCSTSGKFLKNRRRIKSECSPFLREEPYGVPHAILTRKNARLQARLSQKDNRADETPLTRRRTASESSSSVSPGILCVRARDTGLYDCSSGLGEYFHLEHSYMNRPDTGKIDKEKLFSTINKFLAIPGENTDHPKSGDGDFVDILKKSGIFCLQETKQDFFIPNYKCFNSNRKQSRSGGTCIGVHRSIADRIQWIPTGCPDFQAITVFPKTLEYDTNAKFTIINTYDSPENSSYKAKRNTKGCSAEPVPSTLELILEFRAKNENLGEIMLLGDLNARIGQNNTVFEEDVAELDDGIAPPSYPKSMIRASKDTTVNTRGKQLLDFLACNKLSVLNGCTLGDVLGEFTSVNYNGCSVVDYISATPNLYDSVQYFRVLDLTKFSDHKPCLCGIKVKSNITDAEILLEQMEDAPKKYKWDYDDESMHYSFLAIQNLPSFKKKIMDITLKQCKTKEDVESLNASLVKTFQDMADKLTGRPSRYQKKFTDQGWKRKRRRRMQPKSAWFE
jgi:exonuclease III